MGTKLSDIKGTYYSYLDKKARHLALVASDGKPIGGFLLRSIEELYRSAHNVDEKYKRNGFHVAYHNPISSELEFFVARIVYHYSEVQGLHWEVYLRCQKGKTAPDVRIDHNGKTLAIIEIKAKAGWIQPFFSDERAIKDLRKLKQGTSSFNPDDLIKRIRGQLAKYQKTYDIAPKQIFVLLPSLALVHRKRSKRSVKDYLNDFEKNSGLPETNLILLSNNLSLDLSPIEKGKKYNPTGRFEGLIKYLVHETGIKKSLE